MSAATAACSIGVSASVGSGDDLVVTLPRPPLAPSATAAAAVFCVPDACSVGSRKDPPEPIETGAGAAAFNALSRSLAACWRWGANAGSAAVSMFSYSPSVCRLRVRAVLSLRLPPKYPANPPMSAPAPAPSSAPAPAPTAAPMAVLPKNVPAIPPANAPNPPVMTPPMAAPAAALPATLAALARLLGGPTLDSAFSRACDAASRCR